MTYVYVFEDNEGIETYEFIFKSHRFMLWFDGDEPGWTFVTMCDERIMECGEIPEKLLKRINNLPSKILPEKQE